MADKYDTIIIGAGAAGLGAALYCARFTLKTLVIAKEIGGTGNEAHMVDNWIGNPNISGPQLMKNFESHVAKYKVQIINDSVVSIENVVSIEKKKKNKSLFAVKTEKEEFEAPTVIFATGMSHRKLNVPGEKEFAGRGVSYCHTCDAAFFKDKIVAVVGGSDSAANGAILLSKYASKVYMLYRGDRLRAEPITSDQVYSNKKIEVIHKVNVKEIFGDKIVKGVMLDNGKKIELNGVFVEIGADPQTDLAQSFGVKIDDSGYVEVTKEQETNISGFFAAGDITNGTRLKQFITAVAEGSKAAQSAYLFLKKSKI